MVSLYWKSTLVNETVCEETLFGTIKYYQVLSEFKQTGGIDNTILL